MGSINLARLVTDPFEATAAVDETALSDTVATAVRMMDNVVDASRFPLPQQAEEARQKEAETARKLREAELARSPAVKAIKRLEQAVLQSIEARGHREKEPADGAAE